MAVAARPRSPLITRHGVRVPGASPSATYSASAASRAVAASSNASSNASSSSSTAARAAGRGRPRRRAAQELLGRLDLRDAVGKLAGHDAVAAQAPVQRVVEAGALLGNWTLSASSVGARGPACGARWRVAALARRRGAPG